MDEKLPTEEHIKVEAPNDFEAAILSRDVFTMRRGKYHITSRITSKHSNENAWQEWAAGLGAAAAAAAPWVIALSPLLLGPVLVFGPPAFDELSTRATQFFKSLGWIS
jgi:hypothetical protein